MGRTHGVHAEPTTLGLKLTIWYEEMKRNRDRLVRSLEGVNVGLISGAVGNYAHMPPELETLVCEELGLTPSPISTQILQRDRHAELMSTLAIISGTLDKMATEILVEEGYAVAYFGGSKDEVQAKHLENRERLIAEGVVTL